MILQLGCLMLFMKTAFCRDVQHFDLLNESRLTELANLNRKWIGLIHSYPDAAWIVHSSHRSGEHQHSSKSLINMNLTEFIEEIENITDYIENDFKPSILGFENNKCNEDLLFLLSNIGDRPTAQMLDAAGKIHSGVLRGNFHWLGDYRGCKNVSVPIKQRHKLTAGFKGEYCTILWNIRVQTEIEFPLVTGVCVPDSCTNLNLISDTKVLRRFINNIPVVNKINQYANVSEIVCPDRSRNWKEGQIVYMCLMAIFVALLIIGTFCDIIINRNQKEVKIQSIDIEHGNNIEKRRSRSRNSDILANSLTVEKEGESSRDNELFFATNWRSKYQNYWNLLAVISGKFVKFLICFSAYTNGLKVFTVTNGINQLNCLHGIRFLSMSWIILGHIFIYAINMIGNIVDVLEDIRNFPFQIITQATFAVDTFFMISGLLLAYLFFKECKKRDGKVNWAYYYLHRIWRLTPAFAMILGFYVTIWIHLGSGPNWPTETDSGSCRKYWWWNLLYILNFKDVNEMCMGWTWYLANDMQFYIISPLLLMLLWKSSLIGLIIIGLIILFSWILTGILSTKYGFTAFLSFSENIQLSEVAKIRNQQWHFFNVLYDKPYCRIGPYLVGILVGYALYKADGRQKFLKSWMLFIGWIIAAFCGVSVIFGLYHTHLGKYTGAVYNSLSRTTWSVAVGWIVFVCSIEQGGPINTILSWKVWVPFSRLTYCAYLVHPMIINWFYNSLQSPVHFQMNTMVLYYFGFLVFAYITAFFASIFFESPMMAIEKLLLGKKN